MYEDRPPGMIQRSRGAAVGVRGSARVSFVDWAQHTARKVPEVTVYFWIIKLLTTAIMARPHLTTVFTGSTP